MADSFFKLLEFIMKLKYGSNIEILQKNFKYNFYIVIYLNTYKMLIPLYLALNNNRDMILLEESGNPSILTKLMIDLNSEIFIENNQVSNINTIIKCLKKYNI